MGVDAVALSREDLISILDSRLDDMRSHANARHLDVVRRLEHLDVSVQNAHQRVSEQNGIISGLQSRLKDLGDRTHALRNEITHVIEDQVRAFIEDLHPTEGAAPSNAPEGQVLTRMDVKHAVACMGIGIGVTLWILHMMGKV